MVATTLSRGGIAIVQVDTEDSDDPHVPGTQNMQRDSISFVLLAPVGSGTTIYFTDRAWNGSAFVSAGGEGTYTWTAGTDLPAGTVITISEAELTAAGMELSDTGETIYAYQGTDANTPTTFLHAIEVADGNTTFNGNLTNTGLVNGTSAIALAADNVSFGERTWNHQAGVLFQNINDTANWHSNENSPHTDFVEGTNAHVAPDVQLWIAGISGGHGLFSVNGDATQNGGLGYNVAHHMQNTSNDGDATTFTQRFWSPTHILFDTVAGKFFVVDSSGTRDRILQGNIGDLLNNPGTAPTMTILWQDSLEGTADGDGITGMQIDRASGHIYFTAENDLLRVNYDTANQVATTLADLGTDPDSFNNNWANEIALDLAEGIAFVVSTELVNGFIEVPPGTPGASFDPGSGAWALFTQTLSQNSIHMVSDVGGANTIVQLNFNEAFDEDNGTSGAQSDEFDDAFGRITDVDINTSTGEIWFTAVQMHSGVNGEVGGIYRATLDTETNTLNVTQIYAEGNGTNQNFLHIHVDEETGFYYVTSQEPGESGEHAVYRGSLSAAPGTAPTLYATVGNINDMTPRGLTVESAPTLTGTGLAPGVTEASNAAASGETTRMALFSGLTASDVDTAGGDELAGATVRISSNFVRETGTIAEHTPSQDFLTINDLTSGTLAGSGIAFSYDAATGVMTLSGPGTVAEYAAALALVRFSTSGDNPTLYGSATSRTVAASVFDGLLHSDEIVTTVSVTGTNDAPVNVVPGTQSVAEDNALTLSAGTALGISDADADPASQLHQVTLSVTQGTLTIASLVGLSFSSGDGFEDATMTFVGTANAINAALGAGLTYNPIADYNGSVTLTFTADDQGANGTGGAQADTDTVTITINAVADIADDSGIASEDGSVSIPVLGNDTFENPDHAITAFGQGANGTVTLDDNGTAGNTTDDFLVYTPNADFNGLDSFTYTVTSGGVTETATVNVTINAVADIADDSATTDEDTAVDVPVLANDTFENASYAITAFGQGANGTVTLNDNGTAGNTTDDYLVYTADPDFHGSDSFTYTVTSGGVTETATVSITVNPVADIADDSLAIDEDAGLQVLDLLANDTFADTGRAITAVGAATNGTVAINDNGTAGDTSDDYVTYTPNANAFGSDSFTYTVTAGGSTETATVNVTINPVNDAPVFTGLDATPTFVENDIAGQVLDANVTVTDVELTDADNFAGATLTLARQGGAVSTDVFGLSGSLSAAGGDLSVGGVVVGTIAEAGGTLTVVFNSDATNARVDAVLQQITYASVSENPGSSAVIAYTLSDGNAGAQGAGGALAATGSVTVSFTEVNDAPAGGDETVVMNEDDVHTFSASDFNFSDIEGDGLLEVVITTLPIAGALYLNGTAITVAGTAVSAADIAGGLLTFEPGANDNGTGYASFTFQVRDDGGTANGGENTDQSPNTVTIDVTALNDAPVNTVGATVNATEGDIDVVLSTAGAAMSVSDVDATADINYTLEVANGTLTIRTDVIGGITEADIQVIPGTGNGTSAISIMATVSQINTTLAALNGLVYTPETEFSGNDTLEVYVNDLGQTGLDTNPSSIIEASTPGIGAATEEDYDTRTIAIAPVDDGPVAQPDTVGTAENVVLTGSLFADNGSGVDFDIDGPPLSISAVEGSAANVGTQIVLASGALLTVNADGSYSYDANGAFNLISAATATVTGAVNDTATDSFTYTLAGGNTATVTVNLTGVDGAGDQLRGNGADNAITGTLAGDLIHLAQGGEDTASGGGGDDGFYLGGELSAGDVLDGGAGSNDQLGLQGNYGSFGGGGTPFVLGSNHLTGIEALVLLTGGDTRFGAGGSDLFSYHLATVDANVGAGQTLKVNFNTLQVGENVIFDGSAETDGSFQFFGGLGNDVLTGGAGEDRFFFGTGRFGAGDAVFGGAGSEDQLGLQGDYAGVNAVIFGAGQLSGIEMVALLTASDARARGDAAARYSYDLTMADGNVAAGQSLLVNASTLIDGETLTFDGSAESDGAFIIYGGASDDVLIGGAGNDRFHGGGGADTFTGGAGNDVFAWTSAAHSTAVMTDEVLDFATGDLIDLSAIDADSTTGGNQDFTFLGSTSFGNVAGELRVEDLGGGQWQVQGDVDGNGIADFAINVTVVDAHAINAADFLLI